MLFSDAMFSCFLRLLPCRYAFIAAAIITLIYAAADYAASVDAAYFLMPLA